MERLIQEATGWSVVDHDEKSSATVTERPQSQAARGGNNYALQLLKALSGIPHPTASKAKGKSGKGKSKLKFKTSGRGRTFNPRVGDVVDYGKKAWEGLLRIKRLINVEEKMFDATAAAQSVNYSGVIDNLSNVAEGSDYNNRNGNSILVQRLHLKGAFTLNTGASAPGSVVCRLMVLRDMLHNSTTDPTPAQVLEVTASGTAVYSPLLHFHDGNAAARRFRVLHDKNYVINANFATTVAATVSGSVDILGGNTVQFDVNVDVGAHTLFQSTAGADASDWVGGLYIFYISSVNSTTPTITYYSRLYFTDN